MIRHWQPSSLLLALLVSLSPLSFTTLVRADDAEARYQTTIEQAVREFSLSNWAEARALFRRAHALSPSARTLRGMGMAAFELKLYVDALRELSAALLDAARPLTEEQRKQVQGLIDQSRAFVGRYQVVLEPVQSRPLVDGQDALFEPGNVLLLALGDHVVSASADGYQEMRVPLRVDGGENLVLRIALQPVVAAPAPTLAPAPAAAPAPAPALNSLAAPSAPAAPQSATTAPAAQSRAGLGTAAWISLGTGVALGGAAAAFWFMGEGKYSDLQKTCGSTVAGCSESAISSSGVKTADALTNVFMGLSAVAVVTSAVLFMVKARGRGERPVAAVSVGPMALQLRGSF